MMEQLQPRKGKRFPKAKGLVDLSDDDHKSLHLAVNLCEGLAKRGWYRSEVLPRAASSLKVCGCRSKGVHLAKVLPIERLPWTRKTASTV